MLSTCQMRESILILATLIAAEAGQITTTPAIGAFLTHSTVSNIGVTGDIFVAFSWDMSKATQFTPNNGDYITFVDNASNQYQPSGFAINVYPKCKCSTLPTSGPVYSPTGVVSVQVPRPSSGKFLYAVFYSVNKNQFYKFTDRCLAVRTVSGTTSDWTWKVPNQYGECV